MYTSTSVTYRNNCVKIKINNNNNNSYSKNNMSRDSSVGIATRYGLGGPGIESRWGRDFPHLSRPALRPTQTHIEWVPGLFHGGKTAGAWR